MKRGEDRGLVVGKATFRGIGNGEIEEGAAAATVFSGSNCQAILSEVPVSARGEHGAAIVQENRRELRSSARFLTRRKNSSNNSRRDHSLLSVADRFPA